MPSPLGLRRRLKKLFGIETPPASVAPTEPPVSLTVLGPKGDEQSTTGPAGSTVLAVSGRMRHPIASGCSDSSCGTCRVEVLEGAENLGAADDRERATLRASGHPEHYRLTCRAELMRGAARVQAFELI
jgi:ferredoxin